MKNKIKEILSTLYFRNSDSNLEWEHNENLDIAFKEIKEEILSLIPNDYRKTTAGIGGNLNVCEFCNRGYENCRCNEVYNKALADVRKTIGSI